MLVRDGTHTFGQIAARSGALSVWLQRAGIVRGDRVAIVADNCVELVVALWAVLRAGGVFVLVNPTTKADKLAYILDDCSVRGVVAQSRLARTVASERSVVSVLSSPRPIVSRLSAPSSTVQAQVVHMPWPPQVVGQKRPASCAASMMV